MKREISEEYLLHITEKSRLDQVQSLDLSGHGLTTLDTSLFSQLVHLRTLNLAENSLTTIDVNLKLPKLRKLDLSDNDLQSLDFLRNCPCLQTLCLEDNNIYGSEAPYIAKTLCPSLTRVDDLDDSVLTSCYNLYRQALQPQIGAVWEAMYAEVYRTGVPTGELDQLHLEMINTIKKAEIVGSHLSLLKVKKAMISELSMELLKNVNGGKYIPPGSAQGMEGIRSTKYSTRVSTGTTPKKEYSTGTPVDMETDKPARKRKRDEDSQGDPHPSKRKREETLSRIPSIKHVKKSTPQKPTPQKPTPKKSILSSTIGKIKEKTKLPPLDDYDPTLFIRCHAEDNDPANKDTKVWQCEFEPSTDQPGETTGVVATCGGRILCLLDCQTGKVLKRYKDNSETESFYTLAWSTLQADKHNLRENTNLLAVAGCDKEIKLISPTQLIMFGTLKGHRAYISCLVFHPQKPNWLFSGSKDRRILLWDIGTPDFRKFDVKYSKLAELRLDNTDPLCLVISTSHNLLLAGCGDSCFAWNIKDFKAEKKLKIWEKPHYEFVHPVDEDVDGNDAGSVVDGLALLQDGLIVSKCVEHRHMYVWDLKQHKKDRGLCGARTLKVQVEPLSFLQYTTQDIEYIYPSTQQGVLSVGDSRGCLYMYNVSGLSRKKMTGGKIFTPSQVLEWPERKLEDRFVNTITDLKPEYEEIWEERKLVGQKVFYNLVTKEICKHPPEDESKINVVVNCVAMSSDREYLVYGTDNNLVCIWRKDHL